MAPMNENLCNVCTSCRHITWIQFSVYSSNEQNRCVSFLCNVTIPIKKITDFNFIKINRTLVMEWNWSLQYRIWWFSRFWSVRSTCRCSFIFVRKPTPFRFCLHAVCMNWFQKSIPAVRKTIQRMMPSGWIRASNLRRSVASWSFQRNIRPMVQYRISSMPMPVYTARNLFRQNNFRIPLPGYSITRTSIRHQRYRLLFSYSAPLF